jgi:hypothetical protein
MIRMLAVLLLGILSFTSCAVETPPKEKKFHFQDQDDTTDALAIPLDNSEEEENAEMNTLEKIQQKEQMKKEEMKKAKNSGK